MSNSYFQFKQFKINQDRTAMKVGTDGVLLGAWTDCHQTKSILDVGTGTGLVALMLAQRSSAKIVALEIDQDAAVQANENILGSPWGDRIGVVQDDFKTYSQQTSERFELIVSNPPFFENSFKAKGTSRTLARHTDSLSYTDLVHGIAKLLTDKGRFAVIIPIDASEIFERYSASFCLFLSKKTTVYPAINKKAKRVLLEFSRNGDISLQENDLVIENGQRLVYTDEFTSLVRDFYLKL